MPDSSIYSHRPGWWCLLLIPILVLIGIADGSAAPPVADPVIYGTIELPPEAFLVPGSSLTTKSTPLPDRP